MVYQEQTQHKPLCGLHVTSGFPGGNGFPARCPFKAGSSHALIISRGIRRYSVVQHARALSWRRQTNIHRKVTMTISIYNASVPVFKQMLTALSEVLRKAEVHATEKNIEPNALLQARLFPDMFPLVRQVQIAVDFSKGVSSRLAGAEVPSWPDTEVTFADLQALIAKALAHIGSFDAAQFEGSENKEIVLRPGTPKEKKLAGSAYLQHYGLPQFFFHVTTAYAILRHNGVEIGKRDYMGAY
jgi:hypothetical protein